VKNTTANGLSLWALVESLQHRFEDRGFDTGTVDAAVISRVGSMLARRSKNDQRSRVLDLRALLTGPTTAEA
jgi:hypothetical protein